MKKTLLFFAFIALTIIACQDTSEETSPNQEVAEIDMSDFFVYSDSDDASKSTNKGKEDKCHSMKVLNRQLKENPGLEKRMYDIEFHTRKAIAAKGKPTKPGGGGGGTPTLDPTPYVGSITIPVVINILESSSENVTQAQIDSQIAILNEDFNNSNPNTSNTPNYFNDDIANVDITFTIAAINRKTTKKTSWGTRDTMKKSKRGGINPTDPANNLNIWVCEIGGGILGYAQFPGGSLDTDGVVVTTNAFGETSGVYGDGRTATHEVGHYLNLRHIWGDGGCSVDDFVTDTPTSDGPNYTCDEVTSCNTIDMTMNYMDYVYDDCMYMFTNGQNDRMRAIFAPEGSRESFVQ